MLERNGDDLWRLFSAPDPRAELSYPFWEFLSQTIYCLSLLRTRTSCLPVALDLNEGDTILR